MAVKQFYNDEVVSIISAIFNVYDFKLTLLNNTCIYIVLWDYAQCASFTEAEFV